MAWRVDFPKGLLQHPSVDYVFVTIDEGFPLTEPRVVAPQADAKGAPCWPHVESGGVLCLTTTKYSAPEGLRVLTMLQHALDVLDMEAVARTEEFRREFIAYWATQVSGKSEKGYALLAPRADDRDIYFHLARAGQLIFADDEDELTRWLKNAGVSSEGIRTTRLVWPTQIPAPEHFPVCGKDVIEAVGREHIVRLVRPGLYLPVVFGFLIDTVPVFAAAAISGANATFLERGFRKSKPRPARYVADTFYTKPIKAISIERIDPSWVHGRDSNIALDRLRATKVGVVGCGAIGGYLAHGLAQAGVGTLTLVDHDILKPGNLGRHVLGSEWIGQRKVSALATQVRRDFPHIRNVQEHAKAFQDLADDDLTKLGQCDVIVLAGLDLSGELAIDRWISSLDRPPPRVWTWTEEFALAGHAVALVGQDRLSDGLDADGLYRGRLTNGWNPHDVLVREVGCGASFHPYDAVDMASTVTMAQRTITDVILGKVTQSSVRMWLGNRETVVERGGAPGEAFDRSYSEISKLWGTSW